MSAQRAIGRGAALALPSLLVLATEAEASGFALREQSASAQGTAFAGASAAALDPSYMFFNPAALGVLDGMQAEALLNYIAPRGELEEATASTILGTPIGGGTQVDDIAGNAFVPALYGMAELPFELRAGLAVNVPFGLQTEYPETWAGRYHAVDSELTTLNVNPVLAWRPLPWLALGAGLQAQYAEAELTNAVDFGTIGASFGIPGAVPGAQDGFVDVDGDDWGYGYTLGVLVEPRAGTRIGLGYRSQIKHELEGTADFGLDTAGVGAALSAATGGFVDTDASADLTTPAILSAGVYHEIDARWAVMAEVSWTDWSEFDGVLIQFDNPDQPDNLTLHDWNDTWFASIGATYRATDTLTVRAGVAFDQTPVKQSLRTPRIPDGDRTWISLGLGWQPVDWLGLDAGYVHIFVEDTEVDLSAAEPGNTFRGNLEASYDNSIDLFAVSAKVRF